jgi:hypothetical protein
VRENRKHGSMGRDKRILPFTLKPLSVIDKVFIFFWVHSELIAFKIKKLSG